MVVFNMISVHKDYGGQGIGRVLAQKSEDFLKKGRNSYSLVSAETTGALSAKVFKKQGFEQITRIVYEDYRDDVTAKDQLIENRRKYAVKDGSSYIYEFVFSPFDPFLNENTPLLPNMELKLTFDRLQAEFSTISVAESNNTKSIKVS